MNNRLMREFEEFEGLSNKIVDESVVVEDNEEDDTLKPPNASQLPNSDLYYEMEKRGLKTTGFIEPDRDLLQHSFDEEFKVDQVQLREKKREKQRKAAQQAGLQRRRMLMEKTLQEEQDELARNHQIGMMIELIKENMADRSLRINVNSISARSLSKAMWVNSTITCLDLSANELNDHAGTYLARILKRNSHVKKIELDNNNLGPKSCQAFGESLLANNTLVYLSLDSNPICGDDDNSGLKTLCDAIKSNKTITSLNLWRTGINPIGGEMLANAIELNFTLLFCDIGHTDIEMSDVKRIVDQLDQNLKQYEFNQRDSRARGVTEEEKQAKILAQKEDEKKQEELAKWLKDRRDQRAEDRRLAEEVRILHMQEEMEEKKRLLDIKKEEDRKAAEEAAAKKAKKKDKAKKK